MGVSRVRRNDALVIAGVGLLARMAVVAWAARAIGPAADGQYYHGLASRLAAGEGYTWRWPDGVVTYAAHYPVGYPAMLALAYAVFGPLPIAAMTINAVVGALAGVGVWFLLSQDEEGKPSVQPCMAGLAVALHPVLVPYTPAIMTEGITASLLVVSSALTAGARTSKRPWTWLSGIALTMGIATLVRPQSIALAPVLGYLALGVNAGERSEARKRLGGAAAVLLGALLVCLPWTARNCTRMERCALVSVNGGWNLAIGTQTETGSWTELRVPERCKTVFQEAEKDACFGTEARRAMVAAPGVWLSKVPAKLRVTFDYFGAAPWYLHEANPETFPMRAKIFLGAVETVFSRLFLLGALWSIARIPIAASSSWRGWLRRGVAAVGLVACVTPWGALAYLALSAAIVPLGLRRLTRAPVVLSVTCAVVALTALTHAVFFGAGRYGLVVVPFVTALAFVRPRSVLE